LPAGGSFSYLAIEGGIAGEPMFGSLAVNARAGLAALSASAAGRRRIADRRQRRGGTADRAAGATDTDPRCGSAGRRIRRSRPNCFSTAIGGIGDQRPHGLPARRPAPGHLHGHNIVSDGTVNGSLQVPGNGSRSC
jgi:hypothetical protein